MIDEAAIGKIIKHYELYDVDIIRKKTFLNISVVVVGSMEYHYSFVLDKYWKHYFLVFNENVRSTHGLYTFKNTNDYYWKRKKLI